MTSFADFIKSTLGIVLSNQENQAILPDMKVTRDPHPNAVGSVLDIDRDAPIIPRDDLGVTQQGQYTISPLVSAVDAPGFSTPDPYTAMLKASLVAVENFSAENIIENLSDVVVAYIEGNPPVTVQQTIDALNLKLEQAEIGSRVTELEIFKLVSSSVRVRSDGGEVLRLATNQEVSQAELEQDHNRIVEHWKEKGSLFQDDKTSELDEKQPELMPQVTEALIGEIEGFVAGQKNNQVSFDELVLRIQELTGDNEEDALFKLMQAAMRSTMLIFVDNDTLAKVTPEEKAAYFEDRSGNAIE